MNTILLIEDNEADQFLGEMIISASHPLVRILKARDGEEALEVLEEFGDQPDLILLDINMPRMNGLEFLEVFSEHNKKEIPVVVMLTSSDQELDKQQAQVYKCVKDYLLKPITKDKVEQLDKLVQKIKDEQRCQS